MSTADDVGTGLGWTSAYYQPLDRCVVDDLVALHHAVVPCSYRIERHVGISRVVTSA